MTLHAREDACDTVSNIAAGILRYSEMWPLWVVPWVTGIARVHCIHLPRHRSVGAETRHRPSAALGRQHPGNNDNHEFRMHDTYGNIIIHCGMLSTNLFVCFFTICRPFIPTLGNVLVFCSYFFKVGMVKSMP